MVTTYIRHIYGALSPIIDFIWASSRSYPPRNRKGCWGGFQGVSIGARAAWAFSAGGRAPIGRQIANHSTLGGRQPVGGRTCRPSPARLVSPGRVRPCL